MHLHSSFDKPQARPGSAAWFDGRFGDDADASEPTLVVATFRQRDQWSRKIARDPRVKLMHRHVLRSLALCARLDGGGRLVIDPTYTELAKAAGCSERTVYRAIDSADENGIVRKARHSDGRVSNAYELLLQTANPAKNAEKAPEKTQEIQRPTLTNLDDAEGSNPATADRVLRVESKEEINTVYVETVCVDHFTSDAAAITEPLIPNQRAPGGALIETVAAQKQQPPERNETEMGTAANGRAAPSPFAQVLSVYPEDRVGDEAKAFFAFCRAVDAGADLSVILEDLTSLTRERGEDVPDLIEALATIERGQARRTGRQ